MTRRGVMPARGVDRGGPWARRPGRALGKGARRISAEG